MSATNVNCNSCGAALSVAESTNFVTCSRCGTPLAIRRTGSSIFTEPAGRPTDITRDPDEPEFVFPDSRRSEQSGLERQTELNRLENHLNRLDLEWEKKKDKLLVRGRYGHTSVPKKGGGCGIALFATVVGIAWGIFAFGLTSGFTWTYDVPDDFHGPPLAFRVLFPLFGLVFAGVGVGWGIYLWNAAERYERAQSKYKRERERIQEQIRQLGG